ncbi:hypothetical protein BKG83_17255 [Mycobacteroides chelonae]|uniref:hypothetical protein n=2 Tax=Mycobacteroides chelonae TaxID=1774 RepID=UPI0008AA287D|nr:hypothetical protein [Mycobacteroides chelonae]OHU55922.1 hypothetical protein BKG83_17255 [Mycobacteroides chelonae]
MTAARQLRTLFPQPPDTDVDVLRWLARESFELTAAAEGLHIVEYRASTVPPESIPRAAQDHLDLPIETYTWHEFVAFAERPEAADTDPVCGYCPHPPHKAKECGGEATPWLAPPVDGEPAPQCPCAVDSDPVPVEQPTVNA